MKYWTQSVGALTILGEMKYKTVENLLPCISAGDLCGEDVPGLGAGVPQRGLQCDGVRGRGSKLHVHWRNEREISVVTVGQ